VAHWTTHRASVAAFERAGNKPGAEQARQKLRSTRAEDYIRQLVEAAPPLTPEQRDRLALLLRGEPV
jgi:hypothetical protein